MHELPITQSILDLVLTHAGKAGGSRVRDVHLVVGELSRIVDESVQFYWNILSEGTMAEGARLRFTHQPLELECKKCNSVFQPCEMDYRCPSCSNPRVRVVSGDDFRVESIDVDTLESDALEARKC
jgi:hydrogenase nickel incorporation protein HypA/HybF